MKEIPLLKNTDIELRFNMFNNTEHGVYANLLAYKTARTDCRILDEVFGVMGWQREYQEINGQLFCSVLIWDEEKKQWIKKQDVGTEGNTAAVKSCASDAFKRACSVLGIGRELYSLKNIYFKLEKDEYHTKDGVIKSYAEFFVRDLEYDKEKGCYKKFVVVDSKGKVRYDLAAKEVAKYSSNEPVIEKQPEPKKVHEMQGQGNICVDCGIEIKPNVATYSNKKFGSPYCFNCQQKHKAS